MNQFVEMNQTLRHITDCISSITSISLLIRSQNFASSSKSEKNNFWGKSQT